MRVQRSRSSNNFVRILLRLTAILCAAPVLAAVLAAQPPAPPPTDDPAAEAKLALQHSEALFNDYRDAQAREAALKALALYQQLNDSHGIGAASLLLGNVAGRKGDQQESKAQYERAIAAFDAAGDLLSRSRSVLGLLQAVRPELVEATPLFARAASDANTAGSKELEGRVFHAWGDRLFALGKYEDTLDRLEQAAALLDAAGENVALGTVYNSLGRLYRVHGRLDVALTYQLKALAMHEKSDSRFNHLQSLNAVAVTYQGLGDLPRARSYLERALGFAKESAAPRVLDFLSGNLASVLFQQGDYQKAAQLLEQVLARGMDSYPVVRYNALSSAYLRLGRRDEALAMAQKALERCTRKDIDCAEARDERAWAYASFGKYDEAIADTRAALGELEELRARLVPNDALKQQFASTREGMYSHAVALQMQQNRDGDALETAELARSRAFVDLLAAHDLPAKEPAREAPLVLRGLRSSISASTATVDDLAAAAARLRSTIVTYWVADDSVFIWVVKADGAIASAQVDVRRAKLAELIQSTTPFAEGEVGASRAAGHVNTRGSTPIALQKVQPAIWRELYDLLIRPVRAALPKSPGALITIVPHGPLAALSFAALQDERGRYLLEDYALHYVPAGAVLQFTAAKLKPGARAGRIMLVADPTLSQSRLDQPLSPLPGARTEVRAISRLVPAGRVTLLEGSRASESNVRDSSAGKTVLHFATHAIVKDDDPFASYLALGRSETGEAGDGHLTAQEIYGLNISADLVVLSACRSGSGRVTGDGIATLARAFISAGAPSLVTSLWDVADEPTNRLLPDFYRSWLAGASKARALRAAQLHVLGALRAGTLQIATPAGPVSLPEHPVFWAGFALVGEPN
jgi:CHAT domain-containing protein/tetratricopeptide (TPR) repeat protein